MAFLSNFPFLDQQEFRLICEDFVASFEERCTGQEAWKGVQNKTVGDSSFIRILLRVAAAFGTKQSDKILESREVCGEQPDEVFEDIDEEALTRQTHRDPQQDTFEVEYEILLSPSYSVPVLYFAIRDSTGQTVTDIELVHTLIVPEVYRSQVRDVGVMGGLSMANHPITDIPAFFIHPCQTADALREVTRKREVPFREYLLLWMGIIGGSVGLNAPLFLGVQQT